MNKRTALCVLAAAVLLPLTTSAQNTRPTRVVISFSAGGPVDMVARILSERLGQELGTAVIVDNKPGANGFLGAQDVLKAKPDGETIWLSSVGTAAINPSLFAQLPYDTRRDFRPVSLVANNVEVFVINGDDPAQSAQEFIDAARQAKAAPAIASSGTGGIPHLAMVQLRQSTGVDFLHVPYRGMAQAIADVVGGQVSGVFADVAAVLPYLQSGRLRAVGIAAGQRHPSLPDVPTFEEQGISKLDSNNWYGLFVSKQTSDATVQALNEAVQKTLADPAIQARLLKAGTQPQASSPAELDALLAADSAKWGELIRTNNIRPE